MNIEQDINILKQLIREYKRKPETQNEFFIGLIEERALENLLTAYEKEKEKNEELERKIEHTYKKMCPECGEYFISKRSDAKHCQKCTKKVAHKKYRETNRAKINEYSKLHMREYRAKKLLKEE